MSSLTIKSNIYFNLTKKITAASSNTGVGVCGYILLFLSYALIVVTVPFSLSICLKVSKLAAVYFIIL